MTMAQYKLEVTTGEEQYAGTWDHIYVTLTGDEGQSKRTELDNFGPDFSRGTTGTYTLKTGSSLGKLLLLKVEKDPYLILPEDEWYCSKIVVTTPEADVILFPCYRWISREDRVELRGGKAMKVFEENQPLLIHHRKKEMAFKKSTYQWRTLDEGVPHIINFDHVSEFPDEIRFTKSKSSEILAEKKKTGIELKFKGMLGSTEKWQNIEDLKKIFWFNKTTMSEYVAEHWKEDDFFGFQFLNGINPNMIKRCTELPPNFPVTEEMVKPLLEENSSLKKEIEKGNIFLYNQKKMDGIPARVSNGKQLHVTPGLILFYSNPENKLMPIAIQLHQEPSEDNPIFLPSDSEADWLLAKMFIKNADVMDHESVHHLLRTHLLAEVYTIATLRCFPVIHPLYKLLIPHFRGTLNINMSSRESIFGPDGIINKCSLGFDGLRELMRRAHAETTYSSLCLPENIAARGLESIPNFYYRDDGLKLWNIINSFVRKMVKHYYPSDNEVRKDTELQDWISEIFTKGFLGNKASGFPECFNAVDEVIKFITVMIFTVTAQHTAVNNGQFDYHWMPNGSLLLHNAPPTTKGQSSMESVLEALPNVGDSASFVAMAWVLSEKYDNAVFLGCYPEERFDESAPKQMIKDFQAELSSLSEEIAKRNSDLKVPYTYLDPVQIENSISI